MMAFLRRHVFHNFLLKMISLLAAVLLWMAVARDPVAEISVTVPIELQHIPANLELSTEKIPQPQIRVRGPARLLRNLGPADVHATLDLAAAKPGERTYDLAGTQVKVPPSTEVVQVVPAQVRLTFDRRARKEVPIKARVLGLYAGATRTVTGVDPPTAVIVGPEKRVQSIDAAFTDAVDATGSSGRATFPGIHIYVGDPLVQVVQPATVTVTVAEQSEGSRTAHKAGSASR